MKKLATAYGCQKFINTVKFSGYVVTHRICADLYLVFVEYTENDNYTKDEGASENREGMAPLVLSTGSSVKARQL